ncbi:MAG: hypothetical protein GYB65_09455 [Chloroflexi bacterium]|nr:hypothetical protein [Chloroflexota bacterium]
MAKGWVYDPHSGGKNIPEAKRGKIQQRILTYAEEHYAGKYTRIEVRFKGKFCYIDAYTEPNVAPGWPPEDFPETREEFIERLRNTPTHLCLWGSFIVSAAEFPRKVGIIASSN